MTAAHYTIQPMTIADYDAVVRLWRRTEGVGLSGADTRKNIAGYLRHNPRMSFITRSESGKIVGAVLCGHEGRRGYLHHLAVAKAHRGNGIGKRLVEACLSRLKQEGIEKCNIFLYGDNEAGRAFWKHHGWQERTDLCVMQKQIKTSRTRVATKRNC